MKGAFMDMLHDLKAPEACRKGCQADCPRSKVHPPVLTVSHSPVCLAQNCIFFKMSRAWQRAMTAMDTGYPSISMRHRTRLPGRRLSLLHEGQSLHRGGPAKLVTGVADLRA